MLREALQGPREVLGPRHPSTLVRLRILAALLRAQGRYGEAEPLYARRRPSPDPGNRG
jgi:hypothetical protein